MVRCSDEAQGQARSLRRMPIKSEKVFRQTIRLGASHKGRILSMYYLPRDDKLVGIGLRVRKHLRLAADRNRVKRRLRFLFYNQQIGPMPAGNYVISYRGPLASAEGIRSELLALLEQNHRKTA